MESYTIVWTILYALSLVLLINLTNLLSHAFSKQNMVFDPIVRRSHYMVPDPGAFSFNYRRQELKTGVFLSAYSVFLIFSFVGLTIVVFIYANHWWQVIIAFIIGNVISNFYSKNFPLRLHSARYYITQIITPMVILLSYLAVIN